MRRISSFGLICLGLGLVAMPPSGFAQDSAGATADSALTAQRNASFGIETFRLWPGRAPQATGDGLDETPTLSLYRPAPGTENGTAVIVAPGGGYVGLAAIWEGRDVAAWFAERGITAFVLTYRVGPKARLPIPLLDGARAVRFVRAHAGQWHISPDRIGMIGFSAGGHLTASVAAGATPGDAASPDPVERAASALDFVILGYPWLKGTVPDAKGQSQYCLFAHGDCTAADYARYQPVQQVTASFPPTFIYQTTQDSLVRPDGTLDFYSALVAKHVPVELHFFANGQHGTGFGGANPALSHWPELMQEWLRGLGLFDKPTR